MRKIVKSLAKMDCKYKKTKSVEHFFDFKNIKLKVRIRLINGKYIVWHVHYLGEENVAHPQGKWQTKHGADIESLKTYLKLKGVEL